MSLKRWIPMTLLTLGVWNPVFACEREVAEGIASGSIIVAAQYLPGADRPTYTRQLIGIHDGLNLSGPAQPMSAALTGVFYRISVGEELNNPPYEQNRYRLNSTRLSELNLTLFSQRNDGECQVVQVHFDSPENAAAEVFEALFLSQELELL
ncbi:MAG: hypothetical protein ACX931_07130 [Saccharospirillum sp.]